ncbi:hypothetical protein, conserved [Leishmania tarentolae]|uniref:Uncharacterized protein n=1 Tax=Leishmania tarentolae TaxID=5689 RepID=A0A640KQY6_LEITA|nr:hypothetical protein, conserved [Leishmania tarentolae]
MYLWENVAGLSVELWASQGLSRCTEPYGLDAYLHFSSRFLFHFRLRCIIIIFSQSCSVLRVRLVLCGKSYFFSHPSHIVSQLIIAPAVVMSQDNDDWGDMVLPGVYMIQRSICSGTITGPVTPEKMVNLELVHLEINETEKYIELLQKSNNEIAAYLKERRESRSAEEEGGGAASMMELSDGGVEEEDDDVVFREALEENALVIARKKRELEQLRTLISGQRCGCLCAHTQHYDPQPIAGLRNETRITL